MAFIRKRLIDVSDNELLDIFRTAMKDNGNDLNKCIFIMSSIFDCSKDAVMVRVRALAREIQQNKWVEVEYGDQEKGNSSAT